MSDWSVGDLAVCVDAAAKPKCPFESPLVEGRTYTVRGVDNEPDCDGDIGLALVGIVAPSGIANGYAWASTFAATRFRKIRSDEQEACEPEFVTLLKRTKVPA